MGIIQTIIHGIFGGVITYFLIKVILVVLAVLIGVWGIVTLCNAIGRIGKNKRKEP